MIRTTFSFVLVAVLILGSFYFVLQRPAPIKYQGLTTIEIGGNEFQVRLAETDTEHRKGLSGTKELTEDEGMLFIYREPAVQGFWMKDMNYPIDIIWIDEEMRVIGVENNVSPSTFPQVFYSPDKVSYVLEVFTGRAERLNIEIGEILSFKHK